MSNSTFFSSRNSMPTVLLGALLAISLLFLLGACGGSSPSLPDTGKNAGGVVLPAERVAFQQIAPFVKMGSAWGDRSQSAHGTFGIFPGGAKSPPHTHSKAYHGVVISGTMTNPFGGEKNPPKMGPGSYWHVPAGEQHVTACVSREPCRFYFHSRFPFDFAPLKRLTSRRSSEAVALPVGKVAFKRMAPFVQMGAAYGKRSTGAHGTFGIFNPGSASPLHTHSQAYHGVVISGTMTNPFNGEKNPPRMKKGSYWYVPGGMPHVTACVSKDPCRFYFHSEGAFDFHPVK